MFININEYLAAASMISLRIDNIEDSKKQDIVTNIEFEATGN